MCELRSRLYALACVGSCPLCARRILTTYWQDVDYLACGRMRPVRMSGGSRLVEEWWDNQTAKQRDRGGHVSGQRTVTINCLPQLTQTRRYQDGIIYSVAPNCSIIRAFVSRIHGLVCSVCARYNSNGHQGLYYSREIKRRKNKCLKLTNKCKFDFYWLFSLFCFCQWKAILKILLNVCVMAMKLQWSSFNYFLTLRLTKCDIVMQFFDWKPLGNWEGGATLKVPTCPDGGALKTTGMRSSNHMWPHMQTKLSGFLPGKSTATRLWLRLRTVFLICGLHCPLIAFLLNSAEFTPPCHIVSSRMCLFLVICLRFSFSPWPVPGSCYIDLVPACSKASTFACMDYTFAIKELLHPLISICFVLFF